LKFIQLIIYYKHSAFYLSLFVLNKFIHKNITEFYIIIYFSNITELRNKYKDPFQKKHGLKLGFMSAFIKASAYALQDQPVVNAVIDGEDILYRDYVDISVAVSTPKVSLRVDGEI